MQQCLIVEDEKILADTVKEYFHLFGVQAVCAYNAEDAKCAEVDPAVCLIDINLPDGSGYDVCKMLKERYPAAKLFFLSARQEDFDILKGYAVGGDDYIVKPISLPVLLAKVKKAINNVDDKEFYRDLCIEKNAMRVINGGKEVLLKPMEFKLFYYFFKNKGETLEKERIISAVWGDGYYSDNTLNVHINRLRAALGEDIVTTVWSVGYRMENQ